MLEKIKTLFSAKGNMSANDSGDFSFSQHNSIITARVNEDKKHEEEKNQASSLRKVYGQPQSMFENQFITIFGSKRKQNMCVNMDALIENMKCQKIEQPLLSRVINNIVKGALKSGFEFESEFDDEVKERKVKEKFELIMDKSSYEIRGFLRDVLINLVSYSNAFVIPTRNNSGKLETLLLVQNKGWSVIKHIGTCHAEEFAFRPETINGASATEKKYKNETAVWHYTYNKEGDEIFGMPIWSAVIPFLKKYNYLISKSIESYSDQAIEKNIFGLGVQKNGSIRAVTPKQYQDIMYNLQEDIHADLITDVPIDVQTLKKTFTSPDKMLSTLELQIIAGLHTSESQLGKSGAGRQDAETQSESTMAIIADFQENLEDWLNKTIVKEICVDLFGDNFGKNKVRFKFSQSFDSTERKENHAAFMFQSGMVDIDEARKNTGRRGAVNKNSTFFNLYQKKEEGANGSAANKTSPKNQHTKRTGTGTSKKTKKDEMGGIDNEKNDHN